MASPKKRIFTKTIAFEGIFDEKEIVKIIKTWVNDNKYYMSEDLRKKVATDKDFGMNLSYTIQKELNEYAQYKIALHQTYSNCQIITVKRHGKTQKHVKGSVTILIEADLVNDYGDKWEKTAWQTVIRAFVNKYFLTRDIHRYAATLKEEVTKLEDQLHGYFGIQKTFEL